MATSKANMLDLENNLVNSLIDTLVFYGSAEVAASVARKSASPGYIDVLVWFLVDITTKTQIFSNFKATKENMDYVPIVSEGSNMKQNVAIAGYYGLIMLLIEALKKGDIRIENILMKAGSGVAGNLIVDQVLNNVSDSDYYR